MVKVLSCSDIHAGNFSPYDKPTDTYGIGSRLKERIDAVNTFFNYGTDNNIKYYVFNGDIFDKRLKEDINVISYIVNSIVDSFSKTPKGSVLYLNVGNHDQQTRYLSPNSCELFNNIKIKDHTIVVINSLAQRVDLPDDTSLLFIPFTENISKSKKDIKDSLDSLNNNTTVFAHLGLDKSHTGRYKRDLGGDYTLNDIGYNNPKVLNIVLGHYHTRDFHKGKDNSTEKSVWYQGNLLPMTFNDVDKGGLGTARGFDLIDTESGYHEFINLCAKPYNYSTFNVIDLDKTKLTPEDITKLSENNYVKLVTPNKGKNAVKDFNDNVTGNIKMVIKPKITEESVDIDIKSNDTIEDVLEKYCDSKGIDNEVKKVALDIIKSI